MGEKKVRPWWHKSLVYASFSWIFSGGLALILPYGKIYLPTWLAVAVAVAWYTFCIWFFLRRDDPNRTTDE